MKTPNTMNNDTLIHWMEKTMVSLHNHAWTFGFNGPTERQGYRTNDLTDRWLTLHEEMHIREIWDTFCNDRGLSTSHDAFDNMA